MILARISRAIREQNWFAVALEFVIVIAGVVIGFQIQGWSAMQSERDREVAYLARLHTEIEELQVTRERSVSRREGFYTRLVEFADMLNGRADDEPEEEHCAAIGLSFVVSNPTDRLAVLDELLSVGGFETIRSPEVRAAIGNYLLVVRRAEDSNALSRDMVIVLHDQFPHLIRAASRQGGIGLPYSEFECDFDGMRADPVFRNAFATNGFGFSTHNAHNLSVDGALSALHGTVDEVLELEAGHDLPPENTE
ncbi:hypothetical protein V0U79_06075 [Hyphobacterium sp. HN65]|uniref:Uncharacterized protein n=1 Tax=Hyphobacterium lacteum TaxID=3116575 RepID=A0ABU7LPT4_9PROT|nr:hypothetical protein [Hyphobacterium sp. HN65]MEE2525926.1 hypothetical protein [Hyphobacterium sp. HN65]